MTNEEAVRNLDIMWKMLTSAYDEIADSFVLAYSMAIDALKTQPVDMFPLLTDEEKQQNRWYAQGMADVLKNLKTDGDTISRQAAIDIDGLDAEIRCTMCKNPMHTKKGCDGNCKYDEKLYEKIIQILDERIKPLSSAQLEPLKTTIDHAPTEDELERIKQAMRNTPVILFPSAQPDLQQSCNKLATDCISRQAAIDALYKMLHDCFWADDEELDAVITTLNDLPSAQPEKAQLSGEGTTSDCISRQAAIDAIDKLSDEPIGYLEAAIDALVDLPSAQPERKTGKWIERNPQNSDKCRLIECDQCGFSHIVGFNVPYEHWIENRNFCERCGADMRKGFVCEMR